MQNSDVSSYPDVFSYNVCDGEMVSVVFVPVPSVERNNPYPSVVEGTKPSSAGVVVDPDPEEVHPLGTFERPSPPKVATYPSSSRSLPLSPEGLMRLGASSSYIFSAHSARSSADKLPFNEQVESKFRAAMICMASIFQSSTVIFPSSFRSQRRRFSFPTGPSSSPHPFRFKYHVK